MDFVIIDCLLLFGLFMINVFIVVFEVFILIQCEYYVLEGLSQLFGSIQMIQKYLNLLLYFFMILLIMFDGCMCFVQQVVEEVCMYFLEQVLEIVILCLVWVFEVLSFGQIVIVYDGQFVGVIVYWEVVVEIVLCIVIQSKEK